jgi:hypothetical protein
MEKYRGISRGQFWIVAFPASLLNMFFDSAHYPVFNACLSIIFGIWLYIGIKSLFAGELD